MPATLESARSALVGRHLRRIKDFAPHELALVLDVALELKQTDLDEQRSLFPGRTLGMIFQKPSTRTRVSFEVAIAHLGGQGLFLSASDLQLGRGETIRDTGVVLSRYLDAIMIRTFRQSDVDELAAASTVPVINGLTDEFHPCQALADMLTVREHFGTTEGIAISYFGDGNNVCHSLMVAAARLGSNFVAATPDDYRPNPEVVEWARASAAEHGGTITLVSDPKEAARGAQVLYTDVWTSMGQEAQNEVRLRDLADYQLNEQLLDEATDDSIVMHCLPAHYGEEITESLLYSARSAVWDQAENRLHAQKALLALVLR